MSDPYDPLSTLDETPPVVLHETDDQGPEPPADPDLWDPDAHDDQDVLEGVVLSETEEVA